MPADYYGHPIQGGTYELKYFNNADAVIFKVGEVSEKGCKSWCLLTNAVLPKYSIYPYALNYLTPGAGYCDVISMYVCNTPDAVCRAPFYSS
jgi:hypothetical protein